MFIPRLPLSKLLPLLICLLCAPAMAPPAEARAESAGGHAGLEAYQAGFYERAVEEWERSVAADSGRNPAAFYFLGNSYYRLNQLGLAALNYRRALLLDPGFREARQNLTVVEAKTNAFVRDSAWHEILFNPATANLLLIAAFLSLWTGCFSLAGIWLWKTHRTLLWSSTISALTIATATGAGYLLAQDRYEYEHLATITEPARSVLSAPASKATALIQLPEATQVAILKERGPWLYVETPGTEPVRGWIRASWSERLWPPDTRGKNTPLARVSGRAELSPATSIP